ncbi:uncharacterized protein LOC129600964 [Paramacrobiotus metropolitanus]|uniref:uncharacterized protein LOC129600964 n=1 Tax=Paramacrobiotus metropolitanus TaxID=2943436 RepID=UPI0024458623|nr:uncharacterized protein LOC129600964 [Paramacrobiotus metropolitanus]
MRPFATGFLLGLCQWAALLQPRSGLIQVYRRSGYTDSRDFVYQVPNNYQSAAGQGNSDGPVYLQIADPEDACSAYDMDPAPRLLEDDRWVPFFLLTNDAPCAPQIDYQNATGSDGSGVVAKVFNAQMKGYSGVIVYANFFKEKVPPRIVNGERQYFGEPPRTTPFPMPIPANITDRIMIDVHFVGYDYGPKLAQYAYNASSTTRYQLNVSSVAVDRSDIYAFLSALLNYKAPQFETPTWWSPSYSSSGSSSSGNRTILMGTLIPCVCLFFLTLRVIRYKHRQRQAAKAATEQMRVAQAAAEVELARIQVSREQQVRRFIESFIERVQAAENEHMQANGVPLTKPEMRRLTELTQVKVTEESDDICPTCQQTFVVDEMKIVLPCSHVGHSACLTTWLTTYSRNCPVCRQPVSTEYTAEPNSDYYF